MDTQLRRAQPNSKAPTAGLMMPVLRKGSLCHIEYSEVATRIRDVPRRRQSTQRSGALAAGDFPLATAAQAPNQHGQGLAKQERIKRWSDREGSIGRTSRYRRRASQPGQLSTAGLAGKHRFAGSPVPTAGCGFPISVFTSRLKVHRSGKQVCDCDVWLAKCTRVILQEKCPRKRGIK
ncbi:hypothetical protein SETIT_2G006000v2 [Setaria italica]|uniref:Uncharacterized protein n=1 Tax=Setaria italica TaxID=4555 RepID=A0A368PTV2_SETIT|nr:hypothetical protein SETIT_2G006000v2 [Setaria italica]